MNIISNTTCVSIGQKLKRKIEKVPRTLLGATYFVTSEDKILFSRQ